MSGPTGRRWAQSGLLALTALTALQACAPWAVPPQAPPPTPPGLATGPWQQLHPGLWQAPLPGGSEALRLDLQSPHLRLRLSAWADRGQSLATLPAAQDAVAALNASFFDRTFRPRGWTVSDGAPWPEVLAPERSPLLSCDRLQRCEVHTAALPAAPATAHTAVAGSHTLVAAGRARTAQDDAACGPFCETGHPRTAVGLSADRRYLVVLLIPGRHPAHPGAPLAQTAQWLVALGAHDGINLDGGGSTALKVRGRDALARPQNEPAHRRLANVLLIEAAPGATP